MRGRVFSRNKRMTRDGVPIWYVFVDESGHPYYDEDKPGPFAMGAIITDDPEVIASIALEQYSNTSHSRKTWIEPGAGELKRSRSSMETRNEVMRLLRDSGAMLIATERPMCNPWDNPIEGGSVTYAGTLSKLLIAIADIGPDGIYRIKLDASDYLNQELIDIIARSAFDGAEGKALAKKKPIMMVDSDLEPGIQTADMFIGEYRDSLRKDDGEFVKRNKVVVKNRKKVRHLSLPGPPRPRRSECECSGQLYA